MAQASKAKNAESFFNQEQRFSGAYSKDVFESLWWAFSEWRGRLIFIAICGLLGRSIMLSNSVLVGMWADSLCKDSLSCRPLPWPFSQYDHFDFLINLLVFVALGCSLTLIFYRMIAATGTRVSQRFHNETLLRVSRAPQAFFDRNPVGRIFSRFSTDFQQMMMAIGP